MGDHPVAESDGRHDDRHAGSDDPAQASVPPGGPLDPSIIERKRRWLTEVLQTAFDQQTAQIKAAMAEVWNRPSESESCLQIVAACQKEVAAFANHVLERHALHPALETVDFLTSLLRQLSEQAGTLATSQMHCPLFQPLLGTIAEAARAAQAKREYLDLESICPQPLDDLDSEKHEIRQTIPTGEAGQHRRVERMLIPGLSYRGTVLRRARVSVYRHVEQP